MIEATCNSLRAHKAEDVGALELHFGKSPEGSGMIEATCNSLTTFPGPEAPSQPPPTDQNGVLLRRPWTVLCSPRPPTKTESCCADPGQRFPQAL